MVDAYPLTWPGGWKKSSSPRRSSFGNHSVYEASSVLESELRLLGAKRIIISSNLPRKLDGGLRSITSQPIEKGVAVYFELNGNEQCMPCDKWDRVEHNLWAVAQSVSALRGLERWGAKEMVSAAFRGFQALPMPPDYSFEKKDTIELRKLLSEYHPDTGLFPDTDKFQAVLNEIRRRK